MDNPKHVGEHQRRAWIRDRLHHGDDYFNDDDYYNGDDDDNNDDVLADCPSLSFTCTCMLIKELLIKCQVT